MLARNTRKYRSDSFDGDHAIAALKKIKTVDAPLPFTSPESSWRQRLPCPSQQRKLESLDETPFDLEDGNKEEYHELGGGPNNPDTVFYLAYGSNLCAETFQGKRGIRPLSQVNVVVPELVMTFDLAGLPYLEPCFANTRYRKEALPLSPSSEAENTPLLSPSDYHKTRWSKGLVGVVYEVTKQDYAHIIATEGGGASYQDILVTCYPLPPGTETVPTNPTTSPFKSHTLFSPILPLSGDPPKDGGRISRPDPDYAQASSRYLKLITDGADEHALPQEYKAYLHDLRPYTITTRKQRLGKTFFMMTWLPLVMLVFSLTKKFSDKKGRSPAWIVALTGWVFRVVWISYDGVLKKVFGDGERTIYKREEMMLDEKDPRAYQVV